MGVKHTTIHDYEDIIAKIADNQHQYMDDTQRDFLRKKGSVIAQALYDLSHVIKVVQKSASFEDLWRLNDPVITKIGKGNRHTISKLYEKIRSISIPITAESMSTAIGDTLKSVARGAKNAVVSLTDKLVEMQHGGAGLPKRKKSPSPSPVPMSSSPQTTTQSKQLRQNSQQQQQQQQQQPQASSIRRALSTAAKSSLSAKLASEFSLAKNVPSLTDLSSNVSGMNDFLKNVDYVYLILFALASIPIAGAVANFIIIVKAIRESDILLAISTFITTLISIFTFHLVDLGLIIKVLYSIDVYSFMRNELSSVMGGNQQGSGKRRRTAQRDDDGVGDGDNNDIVEPTDPDPGLHCERQYVFIEPIADPNSKDHSSRDKSKPAAVASQGLLISFEDTTSSSSDADSDPGPTTASMKSKPRRSETKELFDQLIPVDSIIDIQMPLPLLTDLASKPSSVKAQRGGGTGPSKKLDGAADVVAEAQEESGDDVLLNFMR